MPFFDVTKSLVENMYFLSGPILAILGFAAIIQLRLTKKAIVISSKREAARLAADQIDVYTSKIIPLQNDLYTAELKENIPKEKIAIGEFSRAAVVAVLGEENLRKNEATRLRLVVPLLSVINSMEAFSTYFTKGIADEEIAYSAVGRTFCYSVESLYFDIASCITSKEDKSFQNIVGLYQIWRSRMEKEKLDKAKEDILKKLDEIKSDKVSPIGTK